MPRSAEIIQPRHQPSRRDVLALVAALALVVTIVGLHVHAYRTISPIDELQHIDAVEKFPHIIRRGELIGQPAMREEACRGIDANFIPPACNTPGPLSPADFQEEGYNTTYIHPPLYYGITHVIGKVIDTLPGVDGVVSSSRLVGAFWLSLGLLLLWWLLVGAGVVPIVQFAVLTMIGSTPIVLHASATVNPDAVALAAGGAILLAVRRWESGRAPVWLCPVVAIVIVSFKFTHVAGVGLALVYLALAAGRRYYDARAMTPEVKRYALQIVLIVVAVGLAQLVWSGVQEQLALVPRDEIPMVRNNKVDKFPYQQLAVESHKMLTPVKEPYLPLKLQRTGVIFAVQVLDLAGLAAVASGAVMTAARSRERHFAVAAAISMVVMGPVMLVAFYVSSTLGSSVPSRYGLAMVPAIALCGVPALRHRVVQWAVLAFAVAAAASVLVALA